MVWTGSDGVPSEELEILAAKSVRMGLIEPATERERESVRQLPNFGSGQGVAWSGENCQLAIGNSAPEERQQGQFLQSRQRTLSEGKG